LRVKLKQNQLLFHWKQINYGKTKSPDKQKVILRQKKVFRSFYQRERVVKAIYITLFHIIMHTN